VIALVGIPVNVLDGADPFALALRLAAHGLGLLQRRPAFLQPRASGAAKDCPSTPSRSPAAIPQVESTCAASVNSLMAASARRVQHGDAAQEVCLRAGVHDVWKLTLPSCSVAAPVTCDRQPMPARTSDDERDDEGIRFMAGPPYAGESTIGQPCSESRTVRLSTRRFGGSAAAVADVYFGVGQLGERFAQRG